MLAQSRFGGFRHAFEHEALHLGLRTQVRLLHQHAAECALRDRPQALNRIQMRLVAGVVEQLVAVFGHERFEFAVVVHPQVVEENHHSAAPVVGLDLPH